MEVGFVALHQAIQGELTDQEDFIASLYDLHVDQPELTMGEGALIMDLRRPFQQRASVAPILRSDPNSCCLLGSAIGGYSESSCSCIGKKHVSREKLRPARIILSREDEGAVQRLTIRGTTFMIRSQEIHMNSASLSVPPLFRPTKHNRPGPMLEISRPSTWMAC